MAELTSRDRKILNSFVLTSIGEEVGDSGFPRAWDELIDHLASRFGDQVLFEEELALWYLCSTATGKEERTATQELQEWFANALDELPRQSWLCIVPARRMFPRGSHGNLGSFSLIDISDTPDETEWCNDLIDSLKTLFPLLIDRLTANQDKLVKAILKNPAGRLLAEKRYPLMVFPSKCGSYRDNVSLCCHLAFSHDQLLRYVSLLYTLPGHCLDSQSIGGAGMKSPWWQESIVCGMHGGMMIEMNSCSEVKDDSIANGIPEQPIGRFDGEEFKDIWSTFVANYSQLRMTPSNSMLKDRLDLAFNQVVDGPSQQMPLNCILALEWILMPNVHSDNKKERVSRFAACLLSHDKDNRAVYFADVKRLYEYRNDLLHKGSANRPKLKFKYRLAENDGVDPGKIKQDSELRESIERRFSIRVEALTIFTSCFSAITEWLNQFYLKNPTADSQAIDGAFEQFYQETTKGLKS